MFYVASECSVYYLLKKWSGLWCCLKEYQRHLSADINFELFEKFNKLTACIYVLTGYVWKYGNECKTSTILASGKLERLDSI